MFINVDLSGLVDEANLLQKTMDIISKNIGNIEKVLSDNKIHTIFSVCIRKEKLPPLDHDNLEGEEVFWYLSWEPHGASKVWRIFLRSEQKKSIDHSDKSISEEFQWVITYKKCFGETPIHLRSLYYGCLNIFVDSFKKYMKEYRISLESNSDLE